MSDQLTPAQAQAKLDAALAVLDAAYSEVSRHQQAINDAVKERDRAMLYNRSAMKAVEVAQDAVDSFLPQAVAVRKSRCSPESRTAVVVVKRTGKTIYVRPRGSPTSRKPDQYRQRDGRWWIYPEPVGYGRFTEELIAAPGGEL